MMVFAIISVLVAYSLTLAMTITRDIASREVAANLAAQQIDVARSLPERLHVVSGGTTTRSSTAPTYTITQTAAG